MAATRGVACFLPVALRKVKAGDGGAVPLIMTAAASVLSMVMAAEREHSYVVALNGAVVRMGRIGVIISRLMKSIAILFALPQPI